MGIFHAVNLPPPPVVSATGAQPHAPSKLPPAQIIVPEPPHAHAARWPGALQQAANQAQPDPWVYSFQGIQGRLQPYGPPHLPPSLIIVPEPPHAHAARWPAAMQQAAYQAQPDPWVYTFQGIQGRLQPYGPPHLPPSLIIVPEPPHAHAARWPIAVQQAAIQAQPDPWTYSFIGGPQPYEARPHSPAFDFVPPPVIYVPFTNTPWLTTILLSWRAPDPAAILARNLSPGIPGQSVDNPAPNADEEINLAIVARSWQPPDPPPTLIGKLSPGIPGQSVDQPPFTHSERRLSQLQLTSALTQPDPWTYTFTGGSQPRDMRKLSAGIPGQSIDPPPPRGSELSGTLRAWQPPDPAPTLIGKLSPGIPGQSIDNPPLFTRQSQPSLEAPPLPWQPRYYPQEFSAVVTASQPYVTPWLASVILAWAPPDPLPVQRGIYLVQPFIAPQVDDPPFSYFGRTERDTILRSWLPPDLAAILAGKLSPGVPGQSVDNPPPFVRQMFSPIELPPGPILPRQLSPGIPGQSVDQPPPRASRPAFQLWQPTDPAPILPRKLSPGIPGQSVDPPPNFARQPILYPPDAPLKPWQPLYLAQPFTATGQPFTAPWLASVLSAWAPPAPQPTQRGTYLVQPFVAAANDPPFSHFGRSERDNILAQWQPGPWQFTAIQTPARLAQEGPTPPPVTFERFTVSGPSVEDLFGPRTDISWNWDGGVSKRTV